MIGLAKTYTPQRVEAACQRALGMGAYSYRSVKSMLSNGLDQVPPRRGLPAPGTSHENVRGAAYYEEEDS